MLLEQFLLASDTTGLRAIIGEITVTCEEELAGSTLASHNPLNLRHLLESF